MGNAIYDFFYFDKYQGSLDFLTNGFFGDISTRAIILYSLLFIVIIPLCLKKDLGALAPAAMVGTIALIYVIFVSIFNIIEIIIIQSPSYFDNFLKEHPQDSEQDPKYKINWTDFFSLLSNKPLFFVTVANLIFAFDCQFALVSVYKSLKNRSISSINKLNNYGIVCILLLILIVGTCGFISSPVEKLEIIILRKALGNSDFLLSLGKIILCVTIVCDICFNFSVARLSYFEIVYSSSIFNNTQ